MWLFMSVFVSGWIRNEKIDLEIPFAEFTLPLALILRAHPVPHSYLKCFCLVSAAQRTKTRTFTMSDCFLLIFSCPYRLGFLRSNLQTRLHVILSDHHQKISSSFIFSVEHTCSRWMCILNAKLNGPIDWSFFWFTVSLFIDSILFLT